MKERVELMEKLLSCTHCSCDATMEDGSCGYCEYRSQLRERLLVFLEGSGSKELDAVEHELRMIVKDPEDVEGVYMRAKCSLKALDKYVFMSLAESAALVAEREALLDEFEVLAKSWPTNQAPGPRTDTQKGIAEGERNAAQDLQALVHNKRAK